MANLSKDKYSKQSTKRINNLPWYPCCLQLHVHSLIEVDFFYEEFLSR